MQNVCKMTELSAAVKIPRGTAGVRYEKQERGRYRDCLVFYCDGKIRFERYCYGEAAGLIFGVWATGVSAQGGIDWRQPFDIAVKPEALPKQIEVLPEGLLRLDGKGVPWARAAILKTDKQNGYGLFKALFAR